MKKECLCLDCIYSAQPYGYFPIVCARPKGYKEMWHEVFSCKFYKACPEPPKQIPWQVIICNKDGK